MEFYPDQLFHIYNQGNNRQQIFFSEENYHFFLWKMRAYLLPFGDLIAWCLMPNHFHWQLLVREVAIKRKELRENADRTEYQRRLKKYNRSSRPVDRSWLRRAEESGDITLNEAIGILLTAYTRAINREKGWSGSLFRKQCKARDGWIEECITLRKPDGKLDYRFMPGTDYAFQCFCYIHNNPVDAKLVALDVDWAYSSARDYAGLRKGTLCNLDIGRRLIHLI